MTSDYSSEVIVGRLLCFCLPSNSAAANTTGSTSAEEATLAAVTASDDSLHLEATPVVPAVGGGLISRLLRRVGVRLRRDRVAVLANDDLGGTRAHGTGRLTQDGGEDEGTDHLIDLLG